MDAQAVFQQAALELAGTGVPWLQRYRDLARQRWLAEPMPTRRTEHWKYTSLAALTAGDYLHQPAANDAADQSLVTIPGLEGIRVVFVNGRYNAALSTGAAPAGVCLQRFAEADTAGQALLSELLGAAACDRYNPFTALNACWLQDGLLIDVDRDVDAGTIHVLHLGTGGSGGFSNNQRLLLRLAEGARATLVEHYGSIGEGEHGFLVDVSELLLSPSSSLQHYRLHLEHESSLTISGVYAQLAANANYDSFLIGLGSKLKRIDVQVRHQGEGSNCRLNGVYLPRGQQHLDLHATVDHEQPRGTTEEVYRGIIADEARAVFNGRIHIHPDAQKTVARLSNRNLLLSDRAEINTKPELEIYADDVQCAHGATVSQIDEQALYYLRSRGIDAQEAGVLLSFAFINELIEGIGDEPLRNMLRPVLRDWFGAERALTRHLA